MRPRRDALGLLMLFMLAISPCALAEFFLEPSAGYTVGLLGQSDLPAFSTKTFIFGSRVGYRLSELSFGADYSMGFGTAERSGRNVDFKPMDLGIFLEYNLPFNFHAYGSAFLLSKAKIQPEVFTADFSGQSFRLGLGWSGIPYCVIILESISRVYSQYNGASFSKSMVGTTLGASISFPIPSQEAGR